MSGTLKTYSHLAGRRRMPTEYEIVTSRLHYYVGRGFEVNVPISDWYKQYQDDSPLQCSDWDAFHDPRETTYTRYTALQRVKEGYVDALLTSIERPEESRGVDPTWSPVRARTLSAFRYAGHCLQMIAAYVGQMAPSGRITIAALFQAADEMRRVQRAAYGTALARLRDPEIAAQGKAAWQSDPAWQPFRALLERLLVTYDFGESLVALNACVKPLVDLVFVTELAAEARRRSDPLWGEVLASLDEDCQWHRAWMKALLDMVRADHPDNDAVLTEWAASWVRQSEEAVRAVAGVFLERPAIDRAITRAAEIRADLGVERS